MNTSKWLLYDSSLDSFSRREVTNLLKTFLLIIPIISVILAAVNYSLGFFQIALTILFIPFFCLLSFIALTRGMINLSMIILIFVLIVATTFSCVLGNGVHETGIMVLPVIVLFSSLVLNIRGVLFTTITVILCLAYIVYGEQYGLYPFREVPPARWVDLIVVQTIAVVHIFVTYTFSSITKKNLNRVKVELKNQETYKDEITNNLNEKTELLRLVHHRVKNNLLLINSLIELETHGKPDIKKGLSEITSSIHTIARAHDPLYHTKDYKQVAIRPYLEKLVTTFAQSSEVNDIQIELADVLIFHEKALLVGIILQKILSDIRPAELQQITNTYTSQSDKMKLTLFFTENQELSQSTNALLKKLTQELSGALKIADEEITLIYTAGKDN